MKPVEFHNEVIKIVHKPKTDNPEYHELYYKGKLISGGEINDSYREFYIRSGNINMFDFDVALFPPRFSFTIEINSKHLNGMHGLFILEQRQKKLTMAYFICIHDTHVKNMDINPAKLVMLFCKKVKAKGYKVDYDNYRYEDNGDGYLFVNLVRGENIKEQYNKHIAVFEELYRKAEKEMIQNINRAAKTSKS